MVAFAFAVTLSARLMFCDLLAQAPLNLERNVSIEAVRTCKLVTLEEVARISGEPHRLLDLTEAQAVDTLATATSMAGALLQTATPGPLLRQLYTSDPRLGHAIVEVEPRLASPTVVAPLADRLRCRSGCHKRARAGRQ